MYVVLLLVSYVTVVLYGQVIISRIIRFEISLVEHSVVDTIDPIIFIFSD